MKKLRLVIMLAFSGALVLGATGCGAGETATTAVAEVTTTTAPATTTTTVAPDVWTELEPTGDLPGPRNFHFMAYDSAHGRVILFGGMNDSGRLADTWAYDPANNIWTNLNPVGDVPTATSGGAMPYDSREDKMFLTTGEETWAYDPAANTWSTLNLAGEVPSTRMGPSMVYDPTSGKIILFGGATETESYNDTWAYDPAANTWTNLSPTGDLPPARAVGATVYDSARGKMILFGGFDYSSGATRFNDTWAYDPAANTWDNLNPAGDLPPGAVDGAMVYDSAGDKLLLFYGDGATWAYDPTTNTWNNLNPSSDARPSQIKHVMVYDPARGQVVLFGGSSGSLSQGSREYLNDIWVYGAKP